MNKRTPHLRGEAGYSECAHTSPINARTNAGKPADRRPTGQARDVIPRIERRLRSVQGNEGWAVRDLIAEARLSRGSTRKHEERMLLEAFAPGVQSIDVPDPLMSLDQGYGGIRGHLTNCLPFAPTTHRANLLSRRISGKPVRRHRIPELPSEPINNSDALYRKIHAQLQELH
jgi:hypothetical protein